jgi:hypothetical protein
MKSRKANNSIATGPVTPKQQGKSIDSTESGLVIQQQQGQ